MTIRTRLLLSFMAAALITLAVGSTGWFGLRNISRDLDEIHDVRLPSIAALDKVNFERMAIRAQTLTVQTVPQWNPETLAILSAVTQQRAKSWQAVEDALRIYEPLPQTAEEAGVYRQFQQEYRDWRAIYVQLDRLIAEMRQTAHSEQYAPLYGQYQAVVADMIPISERMGGQLVELIAINQRIADQAATHAAAASQFAQVLSGILIAAGLALSTLIGWTTSRAITRTIGGEPAQMAALTQQVGHGDLTVSFSHTGRETGVYAAMRDMAAQLKTTVAQVLQATHQVSSAAQQIAQGSTDLAQRTEEQASALEETASSMEQLTSTVKQSADNAGQANQLATAARHQAEQGGQVVEQAIVAMSAINQGSRKIADIIGVIDEIAFQTNLLALNATVEAARAGEQGRGFTVVAGEVRKLAQRSADAAKQIKNLINASVIQVEEGGRLVGQSGLTLQEIVGAVKKVSDIVAEIAAATREQASGIEQVNRAILQMDQATQQNAALVEETAAASHAMGDQAVQLQELMRFFTLPEQSSDSPLKVIETSFMVSAPTMPPAVAVNRRHHPRPRVAAKQSPRQSDALAALKAVGRSSEKLFKNQ